MANDVTDKWEGFGEWRGGGRLLGVGYRLEHPKNSLLVTDGQAAKKLSFVNIFSS